MELFVQNQAWMTEVFPQINTRRVGANDVVSVGDLGASCTRVGAGLEHQSSGLAFSTPGSHADTLVPFKIPIQIHHMRIKENPNPIRTGID